MSVAADPPRRQRRAEAAAVAGVAATDSEGVSTTGNSCFAEWGIQRVHYTNWNTTCVLTMGRIARPLSPPLVLSCLSVFAESLGLQVFGLTESLPDKERAEWARIEQEASEIKTQVSDHDFETKISSQFFVDHSWDRSDLTCRKGRQALSYPRQRTLPERLANDDSAWRLGDALESYASRRV